MMLIKDTREEQNDTQANKSSKLLEVTKAPTTYSVLTHSNCISGYPDNCSQEQKLFSLEINLG